MNPAPAGVRLCGSGVAAATATRLLASDGFDVVGGEGEAPTAPVVMLSDAALALLRDIFGRGNLFAGRPRIERRVVAWGGSEVASFPHDALVASGAELAAELRYAARRPATIADDPAFTVHATQPFPETALRRFGRREAMAATVDLVSESDDHACHVEATSSGWLFLISLGAGKAWLLSVGGAPDALLGESRLVAAQVEALGPVVARFETAPRLLETLVGENWLALGTAAIAFDPICGDGTAQAVREAILAAAVIAGVRDGGDPAALLGHYQSMLIAAMRRHLQISLSFYQSGGNSAWWRQQVDALAEGHAWCTARLAVLPEPRFLLRGTRLVPREQAA